MSQYNGDLTSLKNSIIADCVVQGVSVEEGYKRFEPVSYTHLIPYTGFLENVADGKLKNDGDGYYFHT